MVRKMIVFTFYFLQINVTHIFFVLLFWHHFGVLLLKGVCLAINNNYREKGENILILGTITSIVGKKIPEKV